MIIYTPLIGDTIPAFTKNDFVKVPFQHNPAVSDYSGMVLRISEFASNQEVGRTAIYNSKITSPAKFPLPWTEEIGQNLLLNSSFTENTDKWSSYGNTKIIEIDGIACAHITGQLDNTSYVYQSILDKIDVNHLEQQYVYSADVRLDNYQSGTTDPFLGLYVEGSYYNADGISQWLGVESISGSATISPHSNKGWVKMTWVFRIPQAPISLNLYMYARDFTGDLYFKNLKLEKGNTSTMWSPAPEDFNLMYPNKYYKFQIAYTDNSDSQLYFSTVAVGKCVDEATNIEIKGLDKDKVNYNPKIYKGVYEAATDEPAYWYRFQFYDNKENIIQDTGLLLATDTENMVCELRNDLEYNIIYTVRFTIITVNGLEQSIDYQIIKAGELPNLFPGELVLTTNEEEGYVEIGLTGEAITGNFRLYRSTDGQIWDILIDEIKMLNTDNITSNQFKWRDYTVSQGGSYYYGLAQISGDGVSLKKISILMLVDYEDMFLSDGERQLKIRFDPKVSSFKETLSEGKTDTLGSKYPFFSRNAAVGYKEFSISGLISYQMDDNQTFMNDTELGLSTFSQSRGGATAASTNFRTTDLVGYNYTAERTFKLAVLDWLNNGKPKLFRSPTEGNYVVRLMNVSLSPNDTLGRLIHTFSCTAYECDNADYATLRAKNLVFKHQTAGEAATANITISSHTMTLGTDFKLEGPADNIVITTSYPSLGASFILDGQKFVLYGTEYFVGSIEAGQILEIKANVANAYSTITYSKDNTAATYGLIRSDNFENIISQTYNTYETIRLTADEQLNGYYYIYGISVTGEEEGKIKIGDNDPILVRVGETKTFANINEDINILVTEGTMSVTISGRKYKEA